MPTDPPPTAGPDGKAADPGPRAGGPGTGQPTADRPRGRHKLLKIVIAAAVVVAGAKLLGSGVTALSGPPSPTRGALFGNWSGPVAAPLARSVPLRVQVPSVGINAPLIRLGLDKDGAVAVPPMTVPTEAGWFTGDPTPGERGAAVIVGHVDTDYGRAVFYPLGNVQPGALVIVERADKKKAQFRVTSVEVVDKNRFPAQRVYGSDDNGTPQLRIITCGGAFDGSHYADNLVVYTQLVGVTG
ncbi:class F sortase [Catenulispora sp. NF23]|uniref:Class F sortase n=1 Tax=Catenulispora pinistramenti TaxID=2705254 RepID=A0ABS5KX46_9ACTN|nr:class F sortase [Catenulispora pinistramenti]MBS2533930.1 class F sortase [Catenulispora pinistramenti]MBS2550621.1 class F sortase [Catenulispora pinistramenti]